jgi:radical SAM superfamily enzyme YgiQ (UPF0313 family)
MTQANFTTIFVGIESPRAASLAESKKAQNLREDILTAVHRIQAAGIQVMAGMIVGFDSDDASIFEEQFRFIQEARIPISMTGLLNAMPSTPLHERLRAAGRLIAESVGDQFVFTNIVPHGMSRVELYEGYRRLLGRLYAYRNYRRRSMAFLLTKGAVFHTRLVAGREDLAVLLRVMWNCVLRASPRRAWFTLSMIAETALRRPTALREAVTLALMHKHLYEYMRDTSSHLESVIRDLRTAAASRPIEPAR